MREVKLDARIVRPLDAVHTKCCAEQPIRGSDALLLRHAQRQQEGVGEKNELAVRAEKARRPLEPSARVGPQACTVLRDGEVEALIGVGNRFCAAVKKREVGDRAVAVGAARSRAVLRSCRCPLLARHAARAKPRRMQCRNRVRSHPYRRDHRGRCRAAIRERPIFPTVGSTAAQFSSPGATYCCAKLSHSARLRRTWSGRSLIECSKTSLLHVFLAVPRPRFSRGGARWHRPAANAGYPAG